LAVHQDWANLVDQLPWRSDPHLRQCLARFPSLRILRQPLGETLLGFLCSATKQIVQIKQMCHQMAVAFGDEIAPGFHALPDWAALARASDADLRRCGLGFRARYIKATALLLAEAPDRWRSFEHLPYPEAREELVRLPGVGEKVADCILLFGAGRLESFPVDVWIFRVMENRYQLHGWTNPQIAHFGRTHFGHLAGLAQQFLFSAERQETRTSAKTTVPKGHTQANAPA
jgi:N-glycosylase/DNA lyase